MADYSINMPVSPPLLAPAQPRSLISILQDPAISGDSTGEIHFTVRSGPADVPGPELYKLVESPMAGCTCNAMPNNIQILDTQHQLVAKLTHETSASCGPIRSTHKLVGYGPSGESAICDVRALRTGCRNLSLAAEPYLCSQQLSGTWCQFVIYFFFSLTVSFGIRLMFWHKITIIIVLLTITVLVALIIIIDCIKHGGSCDGMKRKVLLELRSFGDNVPAAVVSRCCWPGCKGMTKMDFEVELLQNMDPPRMLALIATVRRFAYLIVQNDT